MKIKFGSKELEIDRAYNGTVNRGNGDELGYNETLDVTLANGSRESVTSIQKIVDENFDGNIVIENEAGSMQFEGFSLQGVATDITNTSISTRITFIK